MSSSLVVRQAHDRILPPRIFVFDGNSRARRATVRYGAMSGPLIQVLDGLALGDKVIVIDMSKWADLPAVRRE